MNRTTHSCGMFQRRPLSTPQRQLACNISDITSPTRREPLQSNNVKLCFHAPTVQHKTHAIMIRTNSLNLKFGRPGLHTAKRRFVEVLPCCSVISKAECCLVPHCIKSYVQKQLPVGKWQILIRSVVKKRKGNCSMSDRSKSRYNETIVVLEVFQRIG